MNKRQLVAAYNANHKLPAWYNVTGVLKLTEEQVNARKKYGKKSLFELYNRPSEVKIEADKNLKLAYNPTEVYYTGSKSTFSVFLKNQYGDYMLITKSNNYLVVVK